MLNACVALGNVPLAAVIVPLNVPAVVGVPAMTPALLIATPPGKPVAVNVIGAVPVAVTLKLYATPTVPVAGGAALVIVGATVPALITMLNAWMALGNVPLAAVMVPLNVPAVVGVPAMTPALLIATPPGKPVAVNVIGAVPVAVTVRLYATPTVPVAGGAALVIVGATVPALITMLNACVALGNVPLAAVIVPLNVPAVVGVPAMTPALLIVTPPGKPVAVNVIGAVPVAVTVRLYATPTVPVAGGAALVIVGATVPALITMLNACVALGNVPLAAVIVPLKVPAVVGVPAMTPALLIVTPRASPSP